MVKYCNEIGLILKKYFLINKKNRVQTFNTFNFQLVFMFFLFHIKIKWEIKCFEN